jgi:hypothetical protein
LSGETSPKDKSSLSVNARGFSSRGGGLGEVEHQGGFSHRGAGGQYDQVGVLPPLGELVQLKQTGIDPVRLPLLRHRLAVLQVIQRFLDDRGNVLHVSARGDDLLQSPERFVGGSYLVEHVGCVVVTANGHLRPDPDKFPGEVLLLQDQHVVVHVE